MNNLLTVDIHGVLKENQFSDFRKSILETGGDIGRESVTVDIVVVQNPNY